MFAGALNPTPEVASRLSRWVRAAWPAHATLGDPGDAIFWLTGDAGRLPAHQVETGEALLAVDGCLWHRDRIPETAEAARRTLAELGATLGADSWPLDPTWDGSFAAAHYHRGRRVLALAVDPIGLRRLFYARRGECVVFGSAQALCAHALKLSPDLAGLAQWLASGSILGRRTLFAGLTEVLPGERIRLAASGERIDSALDQPWHQGVQPVGPEEAAEELAPRLAAQTRRYAAGTGVGLALSAGVDSRLVLGALGEDAAGRRAYTFGDPAEYEVAISRRVARAAGLTHRVIELTGRFFPEEPVLRRQALRCEATAYPFWLPTGEAARGDGVRTLLMGDITDCLQVRIGPLWGRSQRVRRRLRGLLGRGPRGDEDSRRPQALESWLSTLAARRTAAARKAATVLGVDVEPAQLAAAVAEGLDELRPLLLGGTEPSLFQLQERFHLTTVRQGVGSQAICLNPELEILPAFASREILAAAFGVPLETRAWRELLDALGRRLLSRELRRIPTATIPFVGLSSPKPLQEAVWLARWLGDQAIRRLNRRLGGRLGRERLVATQRLRPEYARAASDFYGAPWALSGCFSSVDFVDRVRRTADGVKAPLVPQDELRAIGADAMLAAARLGPGYLDDLTSYERR